jgi:Ca2+-binding EF-hand superfamily protein
MFRPADCRRPGITLTISTLILAACLSSNRSVTAEDRSTNGNAPPSRSKIDHFDLIGFAPDHPVVVRFRIRIGSNGIREFRHRYAMQLFRTLDRKRDNFLTRPEVTQVERLGEIASRFRTLPRTWKDFDTTPTDDRLSPIEFARVVEGALGPSFAVSVPSQAATRSAKLFTRLDADSDGKLVPGEIHNGRRRLKRLDINDDETFSVDELDPLQYETIRPESQPFVALLTANHRVLCDRLLTFYGRNRSPGTTATLAAKQLGLTAEQVRSIDRDGNGRLDRAELLGYLQHPTPHETIDASLPDPRTRRTRLTVVGGPTSRGLARLSRPWGGWTVQLKAKNTRSDRLLTTKFYRLKFHVADENRNKYIEPNEFPQLVLTGASFSMVDSNDDRRVVMEELTEFIKGQTAVQQSRLLLSVSHSRRSLFELLDTNGDGRLAPREFREGYSRLAKLDKDRDGRFSHTDLSGNFILTLEVARASLFTREAMAMPRPPPTSATPTPDRRGGPKWFRKMDRNGDGDVSGREFLGGLSLFDRLDKNRDGLISTGEAMVLEPKE